MLVPFSQIPIGEGKSPEGSLVPFFIDRWAVDSASEHGFSERYFDTRFVPIAVSDPDVIFAGLIRANQDDGLAYSVRPEHDPDDDEDDRAFSGLPKYGQVFLAFVEVRDMGYVVFDWTWRDEDPDDPGYPKSWKESFTKKVWP